MKYVAVCVLSIVTMLSASASPAVPSFTPSFVVPAVVVEVTPGVPDSLLMTVLGSALIALQLRRRQKSLRSPRLAILSG